MFSIQYMIVLGKHRLQRLNKIMWLPLILALLCKCASTVCQDTYVDNTLIQFTDIVSKVYRYGSMLCKSWVQAVYQGRTGMIFLLKQKTQVYCACVTAKKVDSEEHICPVENLLYSLQ